MQQKRSVLITGCSAGGAGHALAIEFAAQGLRVFATARSTEALSELKQKGIETFELDVTRPESIASLKQEITQLTSGKLNILFNNAGTMYEAPAVEADPNRVRSMFDANVFGVFDMVSAFTPLLLASISESAAPPTIINASSILSCIPFPFASAYNGTKAAVAAYSDTLRLELAPLGIKVVTLFMGEVSTRLMSAKNISFGPDSLYTDVEESVKKRSERHANISMSAQAFARQVVHDAVLKKPGHGSGEYLWKGTNAFIIWFLTTFAWKKAVDGSMRSAVGLDKKDKRKLIFEKGQKRVSL